MKYFTIDNFSELVNLVNSRDNVPEGCSFSQHIIIVGEPAIRKFIEQYNPTAETMTDCEPLKMDKKTSVVAVPYIYAEIYWHDNSTGFVPVYGANIYHIFYCYLYNGRYYQISRGRNYAGRVSELDNDSDLFRNYLPYDWDEKNPEPNKIGVVSDRKMNDWAEYLNRRYNTAVEIRDNKDNIIAEFWKSINALNPAQYDRFVVSQDLGEGEIVKNGLRFRFKIEQGGYINQKIDVYYMSGNTLDTFAQMIRGEYNTPKH